jgi:hypothetical protein
MRELSGRHDGDLTAEDDLRLLGMVAGNVTVRPGATFYVSGMVTGLLTIEHGATAIVYGSVGSIVNHGHTEVWGTVVNPMDAQSTIIHPGAIVAGERY